MNLPFRVHRVNGDTLVLWFNRFGALSSARLVVEGNAYEVSAYLPGLDTHNKSEYTQFFGFESHSSDLAFHVFQRLRSLRSFPLFLESVSKNRLHFCLKSERRIPCPRWVLTVSMEGGGLRLVHIDRDFVPDSQTLLSVLYSALEGLLRPV